MKEIEAQGYIAPADCVEVRITLTDAERLNYATAEQEDRYRFCSTSQTKKMSQLHWQSSMQMIRC